MASIGSEAVSTNPPAKISFLTIALIFCSSIGGIIYGYDLGVFSGVMPFVQKQFVLNANQLGLLGGAIFLGGIFGALMTGYLSDRFGRKQMIIVPGVIFILGLIFLWFEPGYHTLLAVRFVFGIAIGIIQVAVPTYLSEMAPTNIRGSAVVFFQLFITVGILIAYGVDLWLTPTGNWQMMYAIMSIPCLLLIVLMFFMPQSTRWLAMHNKDNPQAALAEEASTAKKTKFVDIHALSASDSKLRWSELFAKKYRHTLWIMLVVAVLNQLTAINAFLQYAPSIFKASGFVSATSDMKASVILGITNIIGTAAALLLVDRVGRTVLLKVGTAGVVIAYLFLALAEFSHWSPVTSVIGLTAFILFFAAGPGAVVWLVLSELLPTEIRGKGVAAGLFVNSIASWVVSTVFLSVQVKLGLSGSYVLFAFFTALYFWVAMKWVPEVKQQSLDDVEKRFSS